MEAASFNHIRSQLTPVVLRLHTQQMYTHENDNALASLLELLLYFTSYQVCSGSCFPIAEAVIAVSFSMKDALIKPS